MKKRLPSFLAGMLTATVIGSLGVTALAATGMMNISVSPMRIQVNGEVFIGRDAQGNEVPVFSYNGTTYAPLRALAESFGLTVGYDKENDLATVTGSAAAQTIPDVVSEPEKTTSPISYETFKAMWSIGIGTNFYGDENRNIAQYSGNLDRDTFIEQMRSIGKANLTSYMLKMQSEIDLPSASAVPSLEFIWGTRNPEGGMLNVGYVYFGEEPIQVVLGPEMQRK